ncbi:MAG: hypothetical protein G8345_05800 [Magnetococcales bacterium]|nr:hypothetical protein [Magnetococcales bacterium]NGZ26382.1 hypothetical protein [Magnetococcales bacterium]
MEGSHWCATWLINLGSETCIPSLSLPLPPLAGRLAMVVILATFPHSQQGVAGNEGKG